MMISRMSKGIGYLLGFILFQLSSSPSASADERWLIYADDGVAIKVDRSNPPQPVPVDGFQYVGHVQFPDLNSTNQKDEDFIRSWPMTTRAAYIYKHVFEDKDLPIHSEKPIITKMDDAYVVLYSLNAMNFACTKEEAAFIQVDAPLAPRTGLFKAATTVHAFLCDLESRDKGSTKITFTIEKKPPAPPPANTPKDILLIQTVRVHELYRFRITSGPVFSSLIRKNKGFSLIANSSGQQEISSSKSNDAAVNFPVFLKCYCFSQYGRDILVNPPFVSWDRLSPIIGINLVDNPLKNFYAGVSYEPVMGLDLVGGMHFSKLEQLTGGLREGPVPTGTTLATTHKFFGGWFVGVTADVGVIGSWLGSQITKTFK